MHRMQKPNPMQRDSCIHAWLLVTSVLFVLRVKKVTLANMNPNKLAFNKHFHAPDLLCINHIPTKPEKVLEPNRRRSIIHLVSTSISCMYRKSTSIRRSSLHYLDSGFSSYSPFTELGLDRESSRYGLAVVLRTLRFYLPFSPVPASNLGLHNHSPRRCTRPRTR